jgi:urease accessory protein
MLADARFPAGGHAHSGGLEGAMTAGTVTDVRSLDLFLRGRLATTGVVAAALAAAACTVARAVAVGQLPPGPADGRGLEASPGPETHPALETRPALETDPDGPARETGLDGPARETGLDGPAPEGELAQEDGPTWTALDAEADARTPSPAQREASRRQGRALLRAARAAWPGPWLADLAAAPQPPHHAVVLGATAAAAGCSPGQAALIAAYLTVTGPASAAVRLLALDPIEVSATIARLASAIETAAARGAAAETNDLPYPSAPALDLYAEAHARAEVRLFAS